MKFAKLFISILFLVLISTSVFAQVTNYLILEDIGPYKLFTGVPGRVFSGPPSKYSQTNTGGILDAAGHFSEGDVSYEASYTELGGKWPFIKVEVTQHAGADSDKWLLHEIDRDFRNYFGLPGDSYAMRQIDGNTIMTLGSGGWTYRWMSNNKVISIEYTDLQMTKAEPIEIVRAYLEKHPSTLTQITSSDIRTNENKTGWIKDEMERRLWLCDKWFVRLESDRSKLASILKTIGDHMVVFLNYREKYYGIQGMDDKLALMGYLGAKNETGIRSKLTEYKNWWSANKTNPINLL